MSTWRYNKEVEIEDISEQSTSETGDIENSQEHIEDGSNLNLQVSRNFAVQIDNSTGIVGSAVQHTGKGMIAVGLAGAVLSETAAIAIVPTLGATVIADLAAGAGPTLTTTLVTQSSLAAIGGGLATGMTEGVSGAVMGAAVGTVGVIAMGTAAGVVVAGAVVFAAYKVY